MADYDFRALSPLDFEHLVRDLLNATHPTDYVTFAPGRDDGIDIRSRVKGWTLVGQCKHRPDLTRRQLLRLAEIELDRWALADIDGYSLITTARSSPDTETEVLAVLAALPQGPGPFLHRDSLNALLSRSPSVERKHFKLWLTSTQMLQSIGAAADWQRNEALQIQLQDRVRLHVMTEYFEAALRILNKHGVVVIGGAPGAGKTTLAELLVLMLWSDGWQVSTVAGSLDAAWRALHQAPERTVIFYDDFLGQATLSEQARSSAGDLQTLISAVERRSDAVRLVMTSRGQLLAEANSSEEDRLRRIAEWAQGRLVEVGALDRGVRGRIVYNHVYFALEDGASWQVPPQDRRFLQIVDHPNFNPRIIESVVLRQQPATLDEIFSVLHRALEDPREVWDGSFRHLSPLAVQILLQLVLLPPTGTTVENLYDAVGHGSLHGWSAALDVLRGTWIRELPGAAAGASLQLFDGSRRDFLLGRLTDPALLDTAIADAFTAEQLATVLQLGNDFRTASRRTRSGAAEIAALVERREADVVARWPIVWATGWAAAERDAAARSAANRHQRAASPRAYVNDSYVHLQSVRELIASIQLLARIDTEDIGSRLAALVERVDRLLLDIERDPMSWIPAPLLDLAVALSSMEDDAVDGLAARVALAALVDAAGLEDVRRFPDLTASVQRACRASGSLSLLEQAVTQEIDNLDGYDDPDSRLEVLDDVDSFVADVGLGLSTEYERERIEEYRTGWTPIPKTRTESTFGKPDVGASDDELLRLFDLLVRDQASTADAE